MTPLEIEQQTETAYEIEDIVCRFYKCTDALLQVSDDPSDTGRLTAYWARESLARLPSRASDLKARACAHDVAPSTGNDLWLGRLLGSLAEICEEKGLSRSYAALSDALEVVLEELHAVEDATQQQHENYR